MLQFDQTVPVRRVDVHPGERLVVVIAIDPKSFDSTAVAIGLPLNDAPEVVLDMSRVTVKDEPLAVPR